MTSQFYFVLINSLLITLGAFLIYFLYRYFIRGISDQKNKPKFIHVQEPTREKNSGIIYFNLEMPQSETITFSILDESEQIVSTLISNEAKEGMTAIPFDTKNVKNGIYFFKLESARQNIMRKFSINN